jgi:hypothetical protein
MKAFLQVSPICPACGHGMYLTNNHEAFCAMFSNYGTGSCPNAGVIYRLPQVELEETGHKMATYQEFNNWMAKASQE